MKHYESFNFDGVSSLDKGVWRVHMSDGLYEENVLPSRTIEKDTSVSGRLSYQKKVTQENIKIDLTLYLEDGYSEQKLNDIKSWLFTDYYRPFYFEEYPSKVCYVMLEGEMTMRHDGINAIIDVSFTSSSKYWFGREILVEAGYTSRFDIISNGTAPAYPVYHVTGGVSVAQNLPISIKNIRTNEEIVVTEIATGETITIDCFMENIQSSLPNIYRFDKFNDVYPKILPGMNVFDVTGDVSVSVQYRDVYL